MFLTSQLLVHHGSLGSGEAPGSGQGLWNSGKGKDLCMVAYMRVSTIIMLYHGHAHGEFTISALALYLIHEGDVSRLYYLQNMTFLNENVIY